MLFNFLIFVFVYNKDVFKKVGLDFENFLKMYDELKVVVKKLIEK